MKALRSDCGGEFTSMEFNHFCETNGIHCPMMFPGLPQQNGVTARRNRTILNMAWKIKFLNKYGIGESQMSVIYESLDMFISHTKNDRSLMTELVKHVFVGYDYHFKGYTLFNPNNGKVVVSCDVEFDEEGM
ncbi:UNVERIFIED_CONTAM: hypothetical protein Sindi_1646000 [Sesamum indicum]